MRWHFWGLLCLPHFPFLFGLLSLGRLSVLTFCVHYFTGPAQQPPEGSVLLSSFYRKGNWGLGLSNLFEVILTRICIFIAMHFIPPFSYYLFYPSSTGHNIKMEMYLGHWMDLSNCVLWSCDWSTDDWVCHWTHGPVTHGPWGLCKGQGSGQFCCSWELLALRGPGGKRGQGHAW